MIIPSENRDYGHDRAGGYWLVNSRAVRKSIRLRAQARHRYAWLFHQKLYLALIVVASVAIPLLADLHPLLALPIVGACVGVLCLVDLAWTDIVNCDTLTDLARYMLEDRERNIGYRAKTRDLIPIDERFVAIRQNPAAYEIALSKHGEITRMLIEGEVKEMRELLALPRSELDSELRHQLEHQVIAVEDAIVAYIREEVNARELTRTKAARTRTLESNYEAEVRKAGNDTLAKLFLRKTE